MALYIEEKFDSAEKLAYLEENEIPTSQVIFAQEFNQVVQGVKDLQNEVFSGLKIITSRPVLTTHIGGNDYKIICRANVGKEMVFQSGDVVYSINQDVEFPININVSTHNLICCVYLQADGTIEVKQGTRVPIGTPAAYPTPPTGTLAYSFVVFQAGEQTSQNEVTLEQVNEIVENSRPRVMDISTNQTLSALHDNKFIIITGHVIITIPLGLEDLFIQCFFRVDSGSLTIARETGVTLDYDYSLVINAKERASLIKTLKTTNSYLFG